MNRPIAASASDEDRLILEYLSEKVDPIFVPMMRALIQKRPNDVAGFAIEFLGGTRIRNAVPKNEELRTLLPPPENPRFKLALIGFTATGGIGTNVDKDKTGNRYDSIPIANSLIKAGCSCELVNYTPHAHAAFALAIEKYDGIIVRINTGQLSEPDVPAAAQTHFNELMTSCVARGVPVWSSPAVQNQMGAKDALVKLKDLSCGLPDTYAYHSREELEVGFKRSCAFQPRVIKQNRGTAGEGIWLVWLQNKSYCKKLGDAVLSDNDTLKLMEMNDNHVEYHTVRQFLDFCINGPGGTAGTWQSLFPGEYLVGGEDGCGQIVDQRLLPRIVEGEVRLQMIQDQVFAIIHKKPATSAVGRISEYTFYAPDAPDFADLRAKFEADIPLMMEAMEIEKDSLPLLWTSDFIPVDDHLTPYALSEINCSCVGISKFGAACGPDRTLYDVAKEDIEEGYRLTNIIAKNTVQMIESIKNRRNPMDGFSKSIGPEKSSEEKENAASANCGSSKRIVFVLGGPGSGKGTQCAKLVETFGYSHLSAGDLLRAEVKSGSSTASLINSFITEGKIVPAEITVELLRKAIAAAPSDTVLVDGFPRALDQNDLFRSIAKTECDFVLFFDCDENLLTQRLLERGKTSGRADDNIESIKKRFVTFREQSMPVVTEYDKAGKVRRVDSSVGSADEVFAKVQALFPPSATSLEERARLVFASNPENRCAKFLVALAGQGTLRTMSPDALAQLSRCAKTGLENVDSGLGCYAMAPADYDELNFFFDPVCNDYHNNPSGDKVHITNWSLKGVAGLPESGVLDMRELGLSEPLSMRVRVGRNLKSFPLPGAMTKSDRIKFEKTMLGAFASLIGNVSYGGSVFSMTPHDEWQAVTGEGENPNLISPAKYQELVDAHVMFKDMDADPYLKSAGIASDWPCGRGCYQSADGGFIIWFGEEDQLRIMCMGQGFVLNEVFDRLNAALQLVESIEGIEFATSSKYGYVTSCPSNLGTGMRASVHLKIPNLTADGTDTKAKAAAKPLGLSVRGTGGEHTPIGADGTVDISPSNRLFVTEAEIVAKLFNGVKLLLEKENAASANCGSSKRIVFVLGGPGSGKGTQCAKLVETFGYSHLSAGDLLRAEVKSGSSTASLINSFITEGKIVPAEITVELLRKAIAAAPSDTVLVDGFPRALDQNDLFRSITKTECDFVLFFDCDEDLLTQRLLERGKTSGRADDNIESIKKRFVTFREQSMPVVSEYDKAGKVRRVDSSVGSADEVFAKVQALFPPSATSLEESARLVFASNPENRCAKFLVALAGQGTLRMMSPDALARLSRCAKTGLENVDSGLGCYAMAPADYDELNFFFDPVCNDYHNNPSGDKVHTTNWSLKGVEGLPESGVLDMRELGLSEPLSMRVRVGRNLKSFPLPGAMAKSDRIKFEKTMLGAFASLIGNGSYGGSVFSMTPHDEWQAVTGEGENPNLILPAKYQELVDAHVMFKDMDADPYLKSAGIASDWPCGRGCYQSSDGGFIIWFGEEDQLRIMCMGKGFVLNEVFDRLNTALQLMESIEGIEFATSSKYGYVTSCPSNLGTGMRASVHLKIPNLTADGTDTKAKAAAKPLGLSVRGTGGEHTPIGADGTVDISPSNRLFVTEAEIVAKLFNGVKLLLEKENAASANCGSSKRIVFVLGGPGSGKGTQCAKLVETFGYSHLSAGDLLRAEVKSGSSTASLINSFITEGKIVPAEITVELLRKAIAAAPSDTVLVDGFPRALDQNDLFRSIAKTECDFVLFFDCDENLLTQRLLERGKTSGRADDNIESIKKRFVTFREQSMPVVTEYDKAGKVRRVDSSVGSADEVFAKVQALFPPSATSLEERARLVFASNPENRCSKFLVALAGQGTLRMMSPDALAQLSRCAKTGLENVDSGLGCYAMAPADYDELNFFFDPVCNDYHNNPAGDKVHTTNWSLKGVEGLPESGVLDMRELGLLEPLSMRVRVGRNLKSLPLPGAMTKSDRIKFEKTMLGAFASLIGNGSYGGSVFSMTPHDEWQAVTGEGENPNLILPAKYQELVDTHVMFKDMDADPYLKSAGIASDWPCGRGCYQSSDGGFIIWFGEEDQLRIMCMGKGFVLNEVFDRLNTALQLVESIEGIEFATSSKYGYVTSCPSNLGTGMRASVHLKIPNLTADGTDTKAKAAAKPLGLSVRGTGGEHTPIGADGTVDISPSNRLFVTEAEIVAKLFNGVKLLLEKENAASAICCSSKRIVFVLGGPGSGKGTQCAKLVETFGYSHLSAGDLLRAEVNSGSSTASLINSFITEGKIVPAEITVELLRKAIAAAPSDTVLVDGFPRALDQNDLFRSIAKTECDFVLFFDCDEDLLTQRLLERGKTSGRADDNIESIKKRFVTFREQSMPVVTEYDKAGKVRRVDSSVGSADEVFAKVQALFPLSSTSLDEKARLVLA